VVRNTCSHEVELLCVGTHTGDPHQPLRLITRGMRQPNFLALGVLKQVYLKVKQGFATHVFTTGRFANEREYTYRSLCLRIIYPRCWGTHFNPPPTRSLQCILYASTHTYLIKPPRTHQLQLPRIGALTKRTDFRTRLQFLQVRVRLGFPRSVPHPFYPRKGSFKTHLFAAHFVALQCLDIIYGANW
jgi:hypothetical protein